MPKACLNFDKSVNIHVKVNKEVLNCVLPSSFPLGGGGGAQTPPFQFNDIHNIIGSHISLNKCMVVNHKQLILQCNTAAAAACG